MTHKGQSWCVPWGWFIGTQIGIVVALVSANFTLISWSLSVHSERPHAGAATRDDVAAIRSDLRDLRREARERSPPD